MTDKTTSQNAKPLIIFLLILILVAGGFLRFYNLRWDTGTFPHPDERSTLLFYAPTIRMPADRADLLNPKKSPLNPFWDVNANRERRYTYGHFPLYALVLAGDMFTSLTPVAESLNLPQETVAFFREASTGRGYADVGRGMVALLDVLSVYLVFLIARKLYGDWAGLLAAAFSAFAVLHIQLAHFFAVDPVSTTFVLLTVYASLLMLERRSFGTAVLVGLGVGLAVSSKYSALPVALAPAMAGWLIWRRKPPLNPPQREGSETLPPAGREADSSPGVGGGEGDESLSQREGFREGEIAADQSLPPTNRQNKQENLYTALYLLTVAAIVSFITFALTSPFVLLDFENFKIAVLDEQGSMVSGAADWPFTRQYRNTLAYIYFIEQQIKWGLGIPLGILGFAGVIWAIIQAVRGKLSPGGWIILAGFLPYFLLNGLFVAKFMRYMSPVTPFVIILGVGLLVDLARRFSPKLIAGLGVTVAALTALWAVMFVNGVYATEHSWLTASRWIYDNVPDGACIAVEHWEEGVPRDWAWAEPGMSPGLHAYRQPQLPMYDPDTEQKYQIIRDTLRDCDYLVIASNRMSRTLPRLEVRYPMSTRYYEALFAEELGYTLAGTFATPPQLGPLIIDDQAADESFTVYDHPKAYIFEKTRELSDQEWFDILGNTWQGAVHGYVGEPTLLMRLRGAGDVPPTQPEQDHAEENSTALDKPLSAWPVVADWQWNSLANENSAVAIVVWWLAVQLIGLLAFPLSFVLLKRLIDGGYLFSKSLGLLLVSYGVWLLAGWGLPANILPVVISMLVFLGGVNLYLGWRRRAEIGAFVRQHWPVLLIGEGIFAFVFLLFISFRLANPDLWQPWNGGEKMLEIGFLTAIVKSATMPPYDPFFAGTYINYYYYGLFVVGILIKLTGIAPVIAFNLAVPMLAGFTAINTFSLTASLARLKGRRGFWYAVGVGLLGVLMVAFFSNLDGLGQFLRNLADLSPSEFSSIIPGLETLVKSVDGFGRALDGQAVREYNYWDTSRIIPTTINEFPYWSFLFADLHPHMIGIPFTILFLALVFAWLKGDGGRMKDKSRTVDEGRRTEDEKLTNDEGRTTEDEKLTNDGGRTTEDEISNIQYPISNLQSPNLQSPISLSLLLLAFPFVLGALAAMNPWDVPTYLGLLVAGFAIMRYRNGLRPLTLRRGIRLLIETALFGGAMLLLAVALYWPFFAYNQAGTAASGLGLVKDKIPLDQFFKLWGFFLLIAFTWLWLELRHPQSCFAPLRGISLFLRRWNVLPHLTVVYQKVVRNAQAGYKNTLIAFGVALGITLILVGLGFYALALLIPWLAIGFLLLLRWETSLEQAFVELLVFTSILLLFGVQIVFLQDFLGGGDWYRMNTYFKFFIQVWVMLGIAGAVMLPVLWRSASSWARGWRWLWQGTVLLFIFASMVFLVLGTPKRLDNRFPGARPAEKSLNGMDYMTVGRFEWDNTVFDLKYDYEALTWLLENVHGTPIIAEAKLGFYREWGMRVAAYTGLPSILGGLHQSEQHFPAELGQRDGKVNRFWYAADENEARQLIDELGIKYIYLGQLERALYGEAILDKFRVLAERGDLEPVFENERTVIYRVK